MKKSIYTTVLLLTWYIVLLGLLTTFVSNPYLFTGLAAVGTLGVTWAAFKVMDKVFPRPPELSMTEAKKFFMSRTFWLAFVILLTSIVKGIFGFDISPDQAGDIVDLDWGNVLQAVLGTFLIVVRKEDKTKPLTA